MTACDFCGKEHGGTQWPLGSLGAEWERYLEMRIPAGLSPMGKYEARRAFYAGASVVLAYMHYPDHDREVTVERLRKLRDEAIEFGEWFMKGLV